MPPVPDFDSAMIKLLRQKYELSQATLAVILNVSLATVRQWEIGLKKPSGASAKLLDLLNRRGINALQ